MCAAKFAGTRKFRSTEAEVLCGCTRIPASRQKFCKEHLNSVPSIVASVLPKRVKKQLNLEDKNAPKVLNFAGLIEKRLFRKQQQYKVKWEGSTEESWLNEKLIPDFMKQYYEETGSNDLPNPKIKRRQTIRGSEEIQLSWDPSIDAEEYKQSEFITDPEAE